MLARRCKSLKVTKKSYLEAFTPPDEYSNRWTSRADARWVLDDNGFSAHERECGHTTEGPSKLVLYTVMLSGPARKAWGWEGFKVTYLLLVTLKPSHPQAITNPSNSQ